MKTTQKRLIVNAFYGGAKWYEKGQARLAESITKNNCFIETFFTQNSFINSFFNPSCPYTIKSAIISQAINWGYESILWLDCSIWLNKDLSPIFEQIEQDGYYLIDSGYNCAQTISDKALKIVNLSRDEAEKIPETWSCVFGLNMNNEKGRNLAHNFLDMSKKGVFEGSREHDNQSNDQRFLFHRQDQSGLSLSAYFSNCHLTDNKKHLAYLGLGGKITDETVFLMQGM
jgi:hypothetical protein